MIEYKLPMQPIPTRKAIYTSSRIHPDDYKLEVWAVGPNGNGMTLESTILNNTMLLSRINNWITEGAIHCDAAELYLEALQNNEHIEEVISLYLN